MQRKLFLHITINNEEQKEEPTFKKKSNQLRCELWCSDLVDEKVSIFKNVSNRIAPDNDSTTDVSPQLIITHTKCLHIAKRKETVLNKGKLYYKCPRYYKRPRQVSVCVGVCAYAQSSQSCKYNENKKVFRKSCHKTDTYRSVQDMQILGIYQQRQNCLYNL